MIKNDRQFQLARGNLARFKKALEELRLTSSLPGVEPEMLKAYERGLFGQINEIEANIKQYEALKEGKTKSFSAESILELPAILIQARIARGMTQKDLAGVLNVKEQQIQRWESSDYAGASLTTLAKIVDALGIQMQKNWFMPNEHLTSGRLLKMLDTAGVKKDLVLEKLLSPSLAETFSSATAQFRDVFNAASTISRVFSVPLHSILSENVADLNFRQYAHTKYKLPARANPKVVNAYTVYAHYIAACIASVSDNKDVYPLVSNPQELFRKLTQPNEPLTFNRVLDYAWSCGIIVVPLADVGTFHGAVWDIAGTYVIVLKQRTDLDSRWLFDLLHEMGHIACRHVKPDEAIVEESQIQEGETRDPIEIEANEWVQEALFNGDADEIEQAATIACDGMLERLKSSLPDVARLYNVNLGALANHMAYRLSQQGENWWGAAQAVQTKSLNPYEIASQRLLGSVNLFRLAPFDRALILRALTKEPSE